MASADRTPDKGLALDEPLMAVSAHNVFLKQPVMIVG